MNIPLNFSWRFSPDFKKDYVSFAPETAISIDLPHTMKEVPLNYFNEKVYQIKGSYFKTFVMSDIMATDHISLQFEGVMVQCDIYLNRHFVGHFISTYLPFDVDITPYVTSGENNLLVVVDGKEDETIPPFGGAIDYLTYAGIYREVTINIRPKVYIKDLQVDGDMQGIINITPTIINPHNEAFDLEYILRDGKSGVATFTADRFTIKNPKLWSPNKPFRYTLTATLTTKQGSDTRVATFGFRTATFTKDGFFLNGQRLKLIGLNRHQAYPYIGYAASRSLQYFDADILKDVLGVNVVRSSHYPPSRHFLDRCDQIGLLVINEIPGWQYVSVDKAWRTNFIDFLTRMLTFNYNHPSIILNSIRINESQDDDELYLRASIIARKIDPSRMTTGVRNFAKSKLFEDVYAYNDFSHEGNNPGLESPHKILSKRDRNVPYLITENNGHMFPTKPYDDEIHRISHLKRHLSVLDAAYQYPQINGVINWCYADYQTHRDFGSGDHVCYHGVLDQFRLPKYAAMAFTANYAQYKYLNVASTLNIGEYKATLLPPTLLMTNCDYVKAYRNDELIGTFYPNKKLFPHLPHPPIIIDSYIPLSFNEDNFFSKKDGQTIKEILTFASINGFNHLRLTHKLKVLRIMRKYRLVYADLVDLWNKYVASWGQGSFVYNFVGYQNDLPVISQRRGPSLKMRLQPTVYSDHLTIAKSYDTGIIQIQLVDEYGTPAAYSFAPLTIDVSDNLVLIGPKNPSLVAGNYLVLVKTTTPGKALVSISTPDSEPITIRFTIS